MNSCIDKSVVLRQRDERIKWFFFFCTLLNQFVVLDECKYHLYIFKKYKIDIDFFKQALSVLSFIHANVSFIGFKYRKMSFG